MILNIFVLILATCLYLAVTIDAFKTYQKIKKDKFIKYLNLVFIIIYTAAYTNFLIGMIYLLERNY